MNQKTKKLFRVSFLIATIIFVTAVLSDISLSFFYMGKDLPYYEAIPIGVGFGTFGVLINTALLMFLLWNSPRIEKAFSGIFESDDAEEPEHTTSEQKKNLAKNQNPTQQ
jgi:hypothetical protein